jgi:hypothetical protein
MAADTVDALRSRLGDDGSAEAHAQGRALTLDEAVELALAADAGAPFALDAG